MECRESQPSARLHHSAEVRKYSQLLPEYENNYTLGQTQYKLQSTGSGNFNISAIWYGGAFETNRGYHFNFYIHFVDATGTEQSIPIFTTVTGSFGNPGKAVKVHLDPGLQFWFELEYTGGGSTHNFFSIGTTIEKYNYANYETGYHAANSYPDFPFQYDNFAHKSTDYFHIYNGPSQLLYNETSYGENEIKRYMVIGFEDAWEDLNFLDFDYNDVVLYIDGDLPIPEAKRFFAEDLQSFDWDFNDIVVDCEYKRNVLRAVGGTVPVYVEFYDPKGSGAFFKVNEHNYLSDATSIEANRRGRNVELHEWMYNQNIAQGNTPTKELKDSNGNYRPINVGAEDGLTLEPVVLLQWANPLTLEQLKAIGNNPSDVSFFVGSNLKRLDYVDITDENKIVYDATMCPSKVMGTVQTRWMIEFQTITKGYPTFYKGNNPSSEQDLNNIWCNYNIDTRYMWDPLNPNKKAPED